MLKTTIVQSVGYKVCKKISQRGGLGGRNSSAEAEDSILGNLISYSGSNKPF